MSPRMDPDFDWGGVQASTPVYSKGVYQVSIDGVRGSAWPKRDSKGDPTSEVTEVIRFRPKMMGVIGSDGKLKTEHEGKDIAGQSVEDINLWVHTEGGLKQAKRIMMAVLGYNPEDDSEEDKFNKFLKDSGKDLTWSREEREDGEGYILTIGEGWVELFKGKAAKVHMEPQTREVEGRDPIVQQNFTRVIPVNA